MPRMLADLYLVITALSFPSVLFLFFFQSSAMLTLFLYACKITTRTYQSIEQLNRVFGTTDTDLTAESDNDAMCIFMSKVGIDELYNSTDRATSQDFVPLGQTMFPESYKN